MAHLRGARASFLCVTETESMATVFPSSHSPVSGGHLHASDKRCAPNMCRGKRVCVHRDRVLSVGVGALGGWVRAGGEGAPACVGGKGYTGIAVLLCLWGWAAGGAPRLRYIYI